jgi:hypothetical protein
VNRIRQKKKASLWQILYSDKARNHLTAVEPQLQNMGLTMICLGGCVIAYKLPDSVRIALFSNKCAIQFGEQSDAIFGKD